MCVALVGGLTAGAQGQTDACAGTEDAGRLTPDNEQWPNRDRIAALKTSNPDLWRKVCADLPHPPANGGGGPVLVSNLGQASGTDSGTFSWGLNLSDRDHLFTFGTGSNATGYVLDGVDIAFDRLSDAAAFSKLEVVVTQGSFSDVIGRLVPPPFEATSTEKTYRFESWEAANGRPGGIQLAPNTTYAIAIDVTSQLSGTNRVAASTSDAEDAGAASGWNIANTRRSKSWSGTSFSTHNDSLKIGLNGRPRPSWAHPWVRVTAASAAEGSSVVVTATLSGPAPTALSFWVDMRECDWVPPSPSGRTAGQSAAAACEHAAPGARPAREGADFQAFFRPFINIAAGQTSGSYSFPTVANDGAEGAEAIAFMVWPYREATRAYLGYAGGRGWFHPATPPDGYSGGVYPLWVAMILQSTNSPPDMGSTIGESKLVGRGRSAPAIDAALVASVRDLAAQTHHGQAHVNRWRRVLVAFGLETYEGLTATTATEARDNAAKYHSPLWPQIADLLTKLQTPDPPDPPPQQDPPQQDPPQQDQQQDTPQDPPQQDQQQDPPQDGGTQDGTPQDPPQQDPPQQGYTVDAAVVAKVKALAAQTQHGIVHVNRWNRVLLALGHHDGTGVTDGPITLDEAKQNTKTYSSPVWAQVVTELTNLAAAQ